MSSKRGRTKATAAAEAVLAWIFKPDRIPGFVVSQMESSFVLVTEGGMVGGDQFRDETRRQEGERDEENCHHADRRSSRSTTPGHPKICASLTRECPEMEARVAGGDTIARDGKANWAQRDFTASMEADRLPLGRRF